MCAKNEWDWAVGERPVANLTEWQTKFGYMEEPKISPDGERVAAVVMNEDAEFTVLDNGDPWEGRWDKAWSLKFSPDGRLAGLVSEMAEWTVAVDGTPWETTGEYVWDLRFSSDGASIMAAVQKGLRYYLMINDVAWENNFNYLSNAAMSPDGASGAAVVQTVPLTEGDIFEFQKGAYTVAVDGHAWDRQFVNGWETAFSTDGRHVAAEVRTSLYDYTIAVDGAVWSESFAAVWAPRFHPKKNSVTAPVRIGAHWTLAQDGTLIWNQRFVQLWQHVYSQDGARIAAIVAPEFGRWTVAVDGVPWIRTFGDYMADPVFSPNGQKVAAIGVDQGKASVLVNGLSWPETFDRAWKPVFSPDGQRVAVKTETSGKYHLYVDGQRHARTYLDMADPVFSPDGNKVLVRAIKLDAAGDRVCVREIVTV